LRRYLRVTEDGVEGRKAEDMKQDEIDNPGVLK